MNSEELMNYCEAKKGVTVSFPFDEHTLVFKVMGKMFALAGLEKYPLSVNLKCDPDRALELRETYPDITPGYHMNKKHWNTVELEGQLEEDLIRELIDHSYDLVVNSLSRQLKNEWDELEQDI